MTTTYRPGMTQRCRVTIGVGVGKTITRWRPAGHRSMYNGPVIRAWKTNGAPSTTSLTVVPMNHGTLLPPAAQAAIMSAVAAGSFGRRAKTNAAIAIVDTEKRTTLQPASSVAPTAGTVHVTW